ncbi:TetR family transcriptional regulator [Kribbella steppae]|uniref:TetR family transcriptional regulator n=1 Tax=Kribbella steppae TaxID=2512223 RepID=A0A4V2S0T7_9ACTN|nr:TetR/AcrR family transcriptional regulator C-terminal domain-containing protein [Kribbella steppae]TCO33960.1 TetR family transcriptional regulator [Kribbella steppae]
MKESIWTRTRAAAPVRETLSREQIVQAAIETLDAEGVAGLSMRKLAAKLDAGATSLYWHVPTKDDLIDLVIDETYGEVDVPEPELAGWRAGALLFGHSLRAMVLRHPWLPEVIYTRPSIGPNATSLGSRGLVLFGAAGFADRDVDFAMGSVMSYVFGTANAEVAVHTAIRNSGRSTDEWVGDVLEQARVATANDPQMQESLRRRSNRDLATMHTESFVFGLDALLDGLATRVKK